MEKSQAYASRRRIDLQSADLDHFIFLRIAVDQPFISGKMRFHAGHKLTRAKRPDRNNPHEYHPRIGVQHDYIYRALNDWEKAAFNRLYDQYYYHRHNDFWGQQAMKKLPQLTQSTRMLVCGEDLGMIPDCVAWVMNDLRILSLEIQRMPKDPKQEFGHTDWYPYRSVCTIS